MSAIEHVMVFGEGGRFAAWPANNGVWSWGDEILVGFYLGHYKESHEDWITVKEAAAMINVHDRTIRRYISQGKLKAKKEDNRVLIAIDLGHSLDWSKPGGSVMARSLDGGESWVLEKPEGLAYTAPFWRRASGKAPVPCPGGINFAHPDFAMTCRGTKFHVSYDRGKTWQEPYKLLDIGKDLVDGFNVARGTSSRTDYIVNGPEDCLFFLSVYR